jgi:hypothetical protein
MKKILCMLIILVLYNIPFETTASTIKPIKGPTEDSEHLRLQDMLMNMLDPYILKDLREYYYPNISKYVAIAPWKIEVIETKRMNDFRGFILQITFEIEPTSGGHHVSIGKDRMTYEISVGPSVKLVNHTHLATYPPEESE